MMRIQYGKLFDAVSFVKNSKRVKKKENRKMFLVSGGCLWWPCQQKEWKILNLIFLHLRRKHAENMHL